MKISGLVPALEVVGYVALFAALITNGEQLFPHIKPPLGPLMFLTLFCFSVLACGMIVFSKPYMLFMDKKGKEAAQLVLATTKWLGVLAAIIVGVVAIVSR